MPQKTNSKEQNTKNIITDDYMISKTNPLYAKADLLAKTVYNVTRSFPKDESYGMTSQIRRAALSVILNIIEGFARQGPAEYRRFLIISYGSLKETAYLIDFAEEQGYLNATSHDKLLLLTEELGKILWSIIHKS